MLLLVPRENILERLERLIDEAVRSGRYKSRAEVLRLARASTGYLGEFRDRIEKDPKAGMSGKKLARFADVLGVTEATILHGDALPTSELVDKYPERAAAIDAARKLKLPEAAIRVVLQEDPGGPASPSELYWFRRIEAEAERLAPPADSGSHKI